MSSNNTHPYKKRLLLTCLCLLAFGSTAWFYWQTAEADAAMVASATTTETPRSHAHEAIASLEQRKVCGLQKWHHKPDFGDDGKIVQRYDDTQAFLKSSTLRPPISELPEVYCSDNFMIHFALEGENRPMSPTAPDSLVYAWLDSASVYLEDAYVRFIEDIGFNPPPLDWYEGGALDLYDIYVQKLQPGVAGFIGSDGAACTDGIEAITYMFINNSLRIRDRLGSSPLQTTLSHEFFHMIQNGYYGSTLAELGGNVVSRAKSTSLIEGTAVWAETLGAVKDSVSELNAFDNHYIYLYSNPNVLSHPNRPVFIHEEPDQSYYAYSTVFFWKYLTEQYGDEIIKTIWEHSRDETGMVSDIGEELEVMDSALKDKGGLSKVFGDYLIATVLLQDTVRYENYQDKFPQLTFKEGRDYQKHLKVMQNPPYPVYDIDVVAHLPQSKVWNCNKNPNADFCDLKPAGGAAYHTIDVGNSCNFELNIHPLKGIYDLEPGDLNAVLLKQNTKTGQMEIVRASYSQKENVTRFAESTTGFDKLTLMVFRLSSPYTAWRKGNLAIRYEIHFDNLSPCL